MLFKLMESKYFISIRISTRPGLMMALSILVNTPETTVAPNGGFVTTETGWEKRIGGAF
jgi:hypothetical protein